MKVSILNESEYYRKVYGGWLGKNIGGTLGAPVEGKKELLALDFYPVLQDGPLENDDLDLQLVWLHALEQYGPGLTARELGQEWKEHVFFPFDEYGYALANLRRGLEAPVAGWFNNPFADCMGSPIRSEIWAMVAPGAPEVAAWYAYQDAIVDHAGGEGVYGEMFFAAIESAIFFEEDRDKLIELGMSYVPEQSRTALALRDLMKWHKEGKDWIEARNLILHHHGSDNFTDAPQNIAFTILGWLYGEDFEDAILKATNCGYDTDCTAATLGSILGMLLGPEGLPKKWVGPVGSRVVVSPPIKGFPAPKDLDELTRRTISAGRKVLAWWETDILVHPELPTSWNLQAVSNAAAKELQHRSVQENRYLLPRGTKLQPDMELRLNYGEAGPSIAAGQTKSMQAVFKNLSCETLIGTLSVVLPVGWEGPQALAVELAPGDSKEWTISVKAGSEQAASYELGLCWTREHDARKWSEERVAFSLVAASEWILRDPASGDERATVIHGNRIEWGGPSTAPSGEVYYASTVLNIPSERELRLIAASAGPVRVKLDGKPVIDCKEAQEFMPAYHRPSDEQYVELTLPAGRYALEVEAVKQEGLAPEVYVLPVATRNTSQPGGNYYYTDILFHC
ncbi:ADP-ribosylglycohydrolase family protein [Cohnella fermenti]|nr:ADP-ribosylglycohydrolase family protein [Cohnella fermenti]